MINITPEYFNDWFRAPRGAGEQAIQDLAQMKNTLLGTKLTIIPKLYSYIDPMHERFSVKPEDRMLVMDRAIIRLLDPSLVKDFIANPADTDLQDELAAHIIPLASALGLAFNIEPYTANELTLILADAVKMFSTDEFVCTLHNVAAGGPDAAEKLPLIFTMFTNSLYGHNDAWQLPLDWQQALIQTALLHTLWNFFFMLNETDQNILLSNSAYQAIVAGVPVRERVQEVLDTAEAGPRLEARRMLAALEQSREMIPANTSWKEFKGAGILINDAAAALVGASSTALVTDQFTRALYRDQDGRDLYSGWLRELLAVAGNLKNVAAPGKV